LNKLVETEEELLSVFKDETIRNALYIASPDLFQELLNIEENKLPKDRHEKVFISLYKYYTRMCTRCTPFGTFAGVNLGYFAEQTDIRIGHMTEAKARLDMDYLCKLFYELSRQSSLYSALTFFPNNTLYKINDQWRYVEYQFNNSVDRFHNLVSINDNDILTKIIKDSIEGISYNSLKLLILSFDIEDREAEEYINELVQNQVLISNLYPSVTGREYQFRLFHDLAKMPSSRFDSIDRKIADIFTNRQDFRILTNQLENILSIFDAKPQTNHLVQVDLLKLPAACNVNHEIRKQVAEATDLLGRLMNNQKNTDLLEKFKIAYYERYEDKFLPLAFALDTDIGLGYKNAISIVNGNGTQYSDLKGKDIRTFKLKLLKTAIKNNRKDVEINDSDLNIVQTGSNISLASSFSFMGNLFYNDNKQLLIRYKLAGGSSALNLIGRFGFLSDDISGLCIDLALEEEKLHPDVILAEIAHLPQGRIGNVVMRPHYRNFEIPYLSYSALPAERQIDINDLYVGVINYRIVLYSKKHQKEVIPCLANAHNYSSDSLPIYHFLCDLNRQNNEPSIYWSWGELYEEEFLPRVTYKNIVLTPARWNFETKSFKKLLAGVDDTVILDKIKNIGLPDKVLITQGDNELYVDFGSKLGIHTFLKTCKKHDKIVVEEFLFSNENAIDGYANEIVIPFVNAKINTWTGTTAVELKHDEELFSPLSEWIFLKLYTGKKYSEKLLISHIAPLVKELKDQDIISKWFFIRYADPKDHLRIRFLLSTLEKREMLFSIVHKYLEKALSDRIIWDMQIGTYNRESDRYGKKTIAQSETLFSIHSEMILEILPMFSQLSGNDQVVQAATYIDLFLSCFDFELQQKNEFTTFQSSLFNKEFNLMKNKALRKTLNDDFRSIHNQLMMGMDYEKVQQNEVYLSLSNIYNKFNVQLRLIAEEVKRVHLEHPSKFNSIVASYVHMFINRLFKENQRQQEMKIYYFLTKYYSSSVARKRISFEHVPLN